MPKLSLAKLERHLYSAADRLRQEGLDAATYKDYIFGLLFLKRCSDVFDAEREKIVGRKVEQAAISEEEADEKYGENPDFYDTFFVPNRARWTYLLSKLSDATEPYGGVLDKALGALAEHNESLEHVLDHISFMRMQSNMEFPERFRWGWCPTTGKKADLMFAQHMLAVCKPGGMVITVMPAAQSLLRSDPGVQARVQALRDALTAWWSAHAPRLADLPLHHELNRVRSEFLDTFTAALLPLGTLDRFTLAGVIATWWTDTLPDFKTLLENGFPGVIDGWIDAVADAVEDDDNAGPAFDPFGHKLVRRTMADYLERIAAAKADVARLKGEKEAFEQSNQPEDADEEELESWNYAKDLGRQIKEFKAENKDAKLKQVRAGLLHDLLTRGLDEHGQLRDPIAHPEQFRESRLGRIPAKWEVGTVAQFCDLHNYLRQPIAAKTREGMSGIYPYYGPTGILDYINEFRVDGEYVLIGEDGDHFLKFSTQPMTLLVEGKFNANNHAHILRGRGTCTTPWIHVYFCHRDVTPHVSRQGAGRLKLNQVSLMAILMVVPQPDEQVAIRGVLELADYETASEERQLEKLMHLKSGLMADLLTGCVRVPESLELSS